MIGSEAKGLLALDIRSVTRLVRNPNIPTLLLMTVLSLLGGLEEEQVLTYLKRSTVLLALRHHILEPFRGASLVFVDKGG